MLEISSHLFVMLILLSALSGAGLCLLAGLPIARSMRKTNAEYQNQVGVQGVVWQEIFDRQQNECDRSHRIACDMERRLWAAMRMIGGEKKGSKTALADEMLGDPVIPLPGVNRRPRSRGPRTGSEEVQLTRQTRLDRLVAREVGVPEFLDGTNSKPQ